MPDIFPSESFPTSGCKGVQHSEAGMVRVGNMDRLGQVEGASLGSRGMFPSKNFIFLMKMAWGITASELCQSCMSEFLWNDMLLDQ